MIIEIHTPELEALIQDRMRSGAFQNVDELLMQVLREKLPSEGTEDISEPRRTRAEAAAHMREARKGNRLPEGVTIRDLIDKGRA